MYVTIQHYKVYSSFEGIEPWFLGPLANTLTIRPMSRLIIQIKGIIFCKTPRGKYYRITNIEKTIKFID